jgi:hypothetical protein
MATADVGPGARAKGLWCDFSAWYGWAAETSIAKLHTSSLPAGSSSRERFDGIRVVLPYQRAIASDLF